MLRVYVDSELFKNSLRIFEHFSVVDQSGFGGKPAQPNVFHYAAAEHLIELLMHHGHAVIECILGIYKIDDLAFHFDCAGILFVNTKKALHQCTLTGAVFPHEGMDSSRFDV